MNEKTPFAVYNPTKLEDVVAFLGVVNKAVYGVNPYQTKVDVECKCDEEQKYRQVDEHCYVKIP